VRRPKKPVHGSKLVDQRQGHAEGVIGRVIVRIEGWIAERIDVVEVLHLACEKHLAIHFFPPPGRARDCVRNSTSPPEKDNVYPPAPVSRVHDDGVRARRGAFTRCANRFAVPPIYFDSICRLKREDQTFLYSLSPSLVTVLVTLAFGPR
jgi:hypothetical protein